MRRTLVIIASIIVLLGIGLGLYIVFFANSGAHLTVNNGGSFSTASGTVQSTGQVGTAGMAGTSVAPNLIRITDSPVAAGVSIVDVNPVLATTSLRNIASSTASSSALTQNVSSADVIVHYIDRESGNVYEYGALSRTLSRISNKTLPGIQTASWVTDGSLAFVQFLARTDSVQQLDTYALPANGSGGYFLPSDLSAVLALGQNSVFTLSKGANSSMGSVSDVSGSNPATIFSSPLTSLIIHPAGPSVIASTKAAAELDGYAFSVNGSSFTPILGPYKGLTILPSPSGNEVLYSYTDGGAFHMNVFDLSTGSVTNLPLATIADKCVWTGDDSALYCGVPTSLAGNQPDSWYQGVTSFNDRIWRIDLTTRLATLVLDPTQKANVSIDATNLSIDANGRILVFRNKKDGSLWSYSL